MKNIVFFFSFLAFVGFSTAEDFRPTRDVDEEKKVDDYLIENNIVQESLITAQDILEKQLSEESRIFQKQTRPCHCQKAHAGFHSKPTPEVLLRGKVAKLLELATIQATEKFDSDHSPGQKQKRQATNTFRGSQQGFQTRNRFIPRCVPNFQISNHRWRLLG